MASSEILLFVKEEVAKYDDGKPSSLVIQAIREACLNLVSSKAAEAPGGSRAEGCSCGSHDLAPLYHHPKCALTHAAPSERADPLTDVAKAIRACEGHPIEYGLGMKMSEVLKWIESLSSQEGK